jgi:two-component system LytT family response regulator
MDNEPNSRQSHTLLVRTLKAGYLLIKFDDIAYCKANGSYTIIYLINNKTVVITRSLVSVGKLLVNGNFVRCHRSYLVNIGKVRKLDVNNRTITVLEDEIPVSRRKCCEVMKEFKSLNNKL